MLTLTRKMNAAFTLVELMIVVVIVAILALVAVPLYSGNVVSGKMSEGIAGAGSIRSAMRVYASGHNNSYWAYSSAANGNGLSAIGVSSTDLVGKYFGNASYTVNSTATTYTVKADLDGKNTYIVNEAGKESGTYLSGN